MKKLVLGVSLIAIVIASIVFALSKNEVKAASSNPTYEYYVVDANTIATQNIQTKEASYGGRDLSLMAKNLDYMGKNGWEYCGYIYPAQAIIFKRPVE